MRTGFAVEGIWARGGFSAGLGCGDDPAEVLKTSDMLVVEKEKPVLKARIIHSQPFLSFQIHATIQKVRGYRQYPGGR
jgi:hypothetical protein